MKHSASGVHLPLPRLDARLAMLSSSGVEGHAPRGRLIVTASLGVGAVGINADRTELPWPVSLARLEQLVHEISAQEEDGRQMLLDIASLEHGVTMLEALCLPARLNLWLLEDTVLRVLGVEPSSALPGESAQADDWAALLDDLAAMVPASVFCLDRPANEIARLILLTVFEAERLGVTHGRCLMRIHGATQLRGSNAGAARQAPLAGEWARTVPAALMQGGHR